MDALKLMLAFSPWLAFWLISGGHSQARLQIGIIVAAVMVVVMGLAKLHRGIILWAGVIFFSFALIFVVWLQELWVIQRLGIFASGTLFLLTILSMLSGHPFTESYSREHAPRELWNSPAFIRGNFIVTGVWGLIFLANTLLNLAKFYYPKENEWFYRGIELSFFGLGVLFSTLYSRSARRKRSQLAASEPR